MRTALISILIAASAALSPLAIEAAGFQKLTLQTPDKPDLTIGLWYPSDATVPATANTEFEMAVALDAPIGDTNGGLILISHGFGGWYAGHADTAIALADAGYIVASPSHTGNTWSDMSSSTPQWMLERPRHISRVIDHVLMSDRIASKVNPEKIGVYGFSAGGYTALSLIGGVPDFDYAQNHCRTSPQEFACSEGLVDSMLDANMAELPVDAWGADNRINAAAIAAPGWGFAYPAAALKNVTADVQLWSGSLDKRVPTDANAAFVAKHLPTAPETYWIDKANHFAFMIVPCREAFEKADPEEYEMVCGDAPGFDRYAFHNEMHIEMVRFFNHSLGLN